MIKMGEKVLIKIVNLIILRVKGLGLSVWFLWLYSEMYYFF